MDFDAAVVVNKPQFSKFVHEKSHPGPGRTDHLRKRLLADVREDRLRFVVLAKIRQQQEHPGKPFLTRIEQLIDEICLDADGARQKMGPLSTLYPYQEDSHWPVEYRRSTTVDKAQGQAPIPQGAWRSTICEDPPPKNKKQPQRQSQKPRREASPRNPPSQEPHPIPSLLCLFISRR
jgi:hypothetical protein